MACRGRISPDLGILPKVCAMSSSFLISWRATARRAWRSCLDEQIRRLGSSSWVPRPTACTRSKLRSHNVLQLMNRSFLACILMYTRKIRCLLIHPVVPLQGLITPIVPPPLPKVQPHRASQPPPPPVLSDVHNDHTGAHDSHPDGTSPSKPAV